MTLEEVCEELENILMLTEVDVKVFVGNEVLIKNIRVHSFMCKSSYKISVIHHLE
jgi:hypothetical protein